MKLPIYIQILISLFLATVVGIVFTPESSLLGIKLYDVLSFIGTLFINALKMIVVPLILASIIVGVSRVAKDKSFAKLGTSTLIYYLITGLLSVTTGLILVNLIQPGVLQGASTAVMAGLGDDFSSVADKVSGKGAGDIADVFVRMIPTNIFNAAAQGQLLGIIFFAALFGYFAGNIKSSMSDSLINFWQATYEVMMKITMLVIRFAPLGIFGLVGKIVMTTGLDAFESLLYFFITVLLALAIHFFIVLPLILYLVGGINPLAYLRAMLPAVLMAFSTASSSSTLPLTMSCAEKNVGAPKRVSGFVLPLGATINMDGTALYECVAVIFIAQMYGIEMSFTTQFIVVWLALLTSIGVAGIPAASLVAITLILGVVGLPLEAIALILAVDRILDMCRTSVNVYSDSCVTGIISRKMGATLKV